MGTKKLVVARKKTTAVAKRLTPVSVVASEVFSTEEPRSATVGSDEVVLLINGVSKGVVKTDGKLLREFVVAKAHSAGIRTFSVYADNSKVTTAQAKQSLARISQIEIVTKDSRGTEGWV